MTSTRFWRLKLFSQYYRDSGVINFYASVKIISLILVSSRMVENFYTRKIVSLEIVPSSLMQSLAESYDRQKLTRSRFVSFRIVSSSKQYFFGQVNIFTLGLAVDCDSNLSDERCCDIEPSSHALKPFGI